MHSLKWFKKGREIKYKNKMSSGKYILSENPNSNFAKNFKPQLSPLQMLKYGVFEGKYLNDCVDEFPKEWFDKTKEKRSIKPNSKLNYFGIKSRMSLQIWREKGWISLKSFGLKKSAPDKRGWFQWYCRYWIGRRIPEVDEIQIKRWRSFSRHAGQIKASYKKLKKPPKTRSEKKIHRVRQRQALLQWAYNPFI